MQKTITEEAKPQLPRLDNSYTVLHEQWRNLHFTDRGQSRLHHIAGFIMGLKACGKDEQAEGLAADICQQLDWLNKYGGDAEFNMADGGTLTCPAYRVVLSDDGTFGGFGVLWHSVVHPEKVREAKKAMPWGDQPYKQWMKELSDANKWQPELELWRCYSTGGEMMEREYVQYRYSFNGGLLFHGFGFDPTAVVIGKCRYWSEQVVDTLVKDGLLPEGRRLFYFDSDNRLDQLLVVNGRFAGFCLMNQHWHDEVMKLDNC